MSVGRKLMKTLCRRHYHKSPYTVDIPKCSLSDFIFRACDGRGNKTALIDGISGCRVPFSRLQEESRLVAAGLYSLGVRKNDIVCLYGTNTPEFAHTICGVTQLGAALTIANSQQTSGELSHQLRETKSRLVITTPDCAIRARQAENLSPDVKKTIVIGAADGCQSFSSLLKAGVNQSLPEISIDPDRDVALIPYSSGTTGLPKGVNLTHRNIVAQLSALSHPLFLPFYDGEASLSVLPMVHIAGMVIGMLNPLAQGASVVVLPRFEPNTYLQTIQDFRPTFSLIAPPVVNFFANHPLVDQYDLTSLHTPYSGAAALGRELIEKMVNRLNIPGVRQGYGMSEASPATHTTPLDGWEYGSIGVPLPNTESKVVDTETGEKLDSHQNGEIWVRGPQVMSGYLNNQRATTETITQDGWMKTGDIGYYDNKGHYYIVDRLKEIIKYKGYQIAPAYLEGILTGHPCVEDAAVIGIPDEVAGEIPQAYVVCKFPVHETQLKEFVSEQVAPYKQLRGGVKFVSEIPRSPSGKILRRKILENFENNTFDMQIQQK